MREELGGSCVSIQLILQGLIPVKDHPGLHGSRASCICTTSYTEEAPETFPWVWRRPGWRRLDPPALVLQARSSDRQN